MEQKKISLKNLYLIAIISIGLIGLGVGSTFAMFTASAEIDNSISLTYAVDYTYDVLETADVELAPGETKTITMNITNDTDSALNYAFWYINEGEYDLDFGIVDSSGNNVSTGTIAAGAGPLTYTISVRNNGDSSASAIIGLSSSDDSVVFSEEMVVMPPQELPSNATPLSDFDYILGSETSTITSLYDNSLDNTFNIADNEILLTKYKGTSEDVIVPDKYSINGNDYNVVILSSADFVNNVFTDGCFWYNSIIESVNISNDVTFISYTEYENIEIGSLKYLFAGCSNLVTVSSLPNSAISLSHTFSQCSNLTGTIRIDSSNITEIYDGLFSGTTKPITIEVPSGSTTYTTFSNASLPSNVTLSTY